MNKYADFKEFLFDNYYDFFYEAISEEVVGKYYSNGEDDVEGSLVCTEVLDIEFYKVDFYSSEDDSLPFLLYVRASLLLSNRFDHDAEIESGYDEYVVQCNSILKNGLHNLSIDSIFPYTSSSSTRFGKLSQFLIPYISRDEYDDYAELFLEKYYPEALETPTNIDIETLLRNMGLNVFSGPMSDDTFGKILFESGEFYVDDYDECATVEKVLPPGTIIINNNPNYEYNSGLRNYTLIHECFHWYKHGKFFELQRLLGSKEPAISCRTSYNDIEMSTELNKALFFMEKQADAIASRILMPKDNAKKVLHELIKKQSDIDDDSEILKTYNVVEGFASYFDVSLAAAKIRLQELGYDKAAGINNTLNNGFCYDHSFKLGSLEKNETFLIDKFNFLTLLFRYPELKELVINGTIIFADNFVVVRSKEYVCIGRDDSYHLTIYALNHVDECCLKFKVTNYGKRYSFDYDKNVLFRGVNSEPYNDTSKEYDRFDTSDIIAKAKECADIRDRMNEISKIRGELPASFEGCLSKIIDYKKSKGKFTLEILSEHSYIDPSTLSKLKNGKIKNPNIETVLSLCAGLMIPGTISGDLLKSAGYSIYEKVSEENLIIIDLINNHTYEGIDRWNEYLHSYGSKMRLPSNRSN